MKKAALIFLSFFNILYAQQNVCTDNYSSEEYFAKSAEDVIQNEYQEETPKQNKKALKFSKSKLSLQDFINKLITEKTPGIIDVKKLEIKEEIKINGDLYLEGQQTKIIFKTPKKSLFTFSQAKATIKGFDITMPDEAIAFKTEFKTGNLWTINLEDIKVTGGNNGWYSARGGIYDSVKDSIIIWNTVSFKNVNFNTNMVSIAVYAQDGPTIAVNMDNVELKAGRSHAMYFHPNVSIDLNNVRVIGTGAKLTKGQGLALSHFSGGGVSGIAQYYRLNNVSCDFAPFTIAPTKTTPVIKNSTLHIYDMYVDSRNIYAENTTFNKLTFVAGELVNCSGKIRLIKNTNIKGGDFAEIQIGNTNQPPPSIINISDAKINSLSYIKPADITINNTTINNIYNSVTTTKKQKIKLSNTIINKYGYGKPEEIVQTIK